MLRDAVPKYLSASPLVGMKRLPVVQPTRRLLTPTEERRLLAVCEDAQDRAILIVARDCLIRLGDLLDLTRGDRSGRWLRVADPKGGAPYQAVLTARAARALDAIDHPGRYYFAKFRRAENPRDWPGSVRQRLAYLCGRAGVPYGRAQGGVTFHWATRRTGATELLVTRRVPLPVVQAQGGWKSPETLLAVYAEAEAAERLKAFPIRSRSGARVARNARQSGG